MDADDKFGQAACVAVAVALAGLMLAAVGSGCAGVPRALAPPPGCAWAPLPLRVQLADDVAFHRPAIDAAAAEWNRALGAPAVVVVEGDPDVRVELGGRRPEELGVRCQGARALGTLRMSAGLDVVAAGAFAAHGLGHALGVAHATNEQSVMQPVIDAALMREPFGPDADGQGDRFYRVTEHDAAAVRAHRRWSP